MEGQHRERAQILPKKRTDGGSGCRDDVDGREFGSHGEGIIGDVDL